VAENQRETDPELKNLSINRRYQATRTSKEELISARVQFNPSVWTLALRVKQNATYWLGLVAYDLGNYDTARSYFDSILAEESSTDWVVGARYNRGRSYEAEADALNEALKNATKDAPQEAAQITTQQQALRRQALETYRKTYLNHEPDDQALLRANRLEATLKPQ
jgi:tetratricopeptide (TPR) repeat protein